MKLNRLIDHTILKANASLEEIKQLIEEAKKYEFFSVCLNPNYVALAHSLLKGSNTKVCTVVGFPLGANTPTLKAYEAKEAIKNGADEIDMVVNITMLKEHDYDYIEKEVHLVKEACDGHLLKVILETAMLTDEEIANACKASTKGGADFVKTSTGFAREGGASVNAVKIMKANVPSHVGVKASGGVRTKEDALKMVEAGATRLGTSNGVKIVEDN